MESTALASPCGLIAKSIFNDTYTITNSANKSFTISDKDIAWPADREYKFKRPANSEKT